MMFILGIVIAFVSFTLSACAGLGGSLILVPAMALAFGTKQGIAIAALLLAFNNIWKVFAYRNTIPYKKVLPIICLTMLGATIGASAMLSVEEFWVDVAVFSMILLTFTTELADYSSLKKVNSSVMAFFSGCTSGFSGTSGPLKGLAIRNLCLERMYFVGAASVVSLFGDVVKSTIYVKASLLTNEVWLMVFACATLSPFAVYVGRKINTSIGESMFTGVFWAIMSGYALRLIIS